MLKWLVVTTIAGLTITQAHAGAGEGGTRGSSGSSYGVSSGGGWLDQFLDWGGRGPKSWTEPFRHDGWSVHGPNQKGSSITGQQDKQAGS